jgi:hypothetical protein
MALLKRNEKKGKKKKANWKLRLGIPFFLIVALIWYGFQPLIGSQEYALCRTLIELKIKYPSTLKILTVKKFQNEQRVHYVYIGPYGERKIEMMSCVFETNPETGLFQLNSATLNREPLTDEEIEGFNKGLPYVQTMDLYKNVPAAWDGTYMGLKDE